MEQARPRCSLDTLLCYGIAAVFLFLDLCGRRRMAELLPSALQTCLKLFAVSSGAATALLYLLCVIRLRRLGLMNSEHPAEPHSGGSRRRRIRDRFKQAV